MHRTVSGQLRDHRRPTTPSTTSSFLLSLFLALAGCGSEASSEPLAASGTATLGEVSASASVSADLTPPSTPSNLTWNLWGTTVELSWGASTDDVGVAGYQLFYGSFLLGTFTNTSVSLIGFKAGTQYVFTVKAIDAAGNVSQGSNQTTVLLPILADTTPPTAPTDLTAFIESAYSVELQWSRSSDDVGVVAYQIYSDGVLVDTFPVSSYREVGVQPSTPSYFTVRAVDAAGNVSPDSNTVTVTPQLPDTTPPSTPTGLTVSSITATTLVLSWTPSTDDVGVTTYEAYRGSGAIAGITPFTSVLVRDLPPATTLSFWVKAGDAAGHWSSASSQISVTTLAAGGGGGGGGGGEMCCDSGVRINAGGPLVGRYLPDAGFSGGSTSSTTHAIDLSGSALLPHEGVFQSERHGEFTYTLPYEYSGGNNVNLYFAETTFTSAGQRTFDVIINGSTVLRAFDVFAAAGGAYKAVARSFYIPRSSGDQIVIQFTSNGGAGTPTVCGLDLDSGALPTSLDPPTALQARSDGKRVFLSWIFTAGATQYVIERDGIQIGTSTTQSYTDGQVTAGKSYTYRVRAKNSATTISDPSSAVSIAVLRSSGP